MELEKALRSAIKMITGRSRMDALKFEEEKVEGEYD